MQNQKQVRRIYYYDLIKIIAAFMVVFYHLGSLDYGDIGEGWYIPNFNRILMNICSASIPLFFMVNGALLLRKKYEIKQLGFKIVKIIFLIVVWKIVNFPSWFFKTLIILYVLYPILYYMYYEKKKWLWTAIIGLLIFPFLYNYIILILASLGRCMIISGEKIIFSELPRSGLFTLYSIVYFCVGKMLSERVLTKKTSIVLGILGLALSIGESILGVKAYGYILDGVNGSFPTIGALCMSIAIFNCLHLIHLNEKSKKVINYLSPCVLGVYIFHLQIMKWLRQFGAFSILTLGQSILMSVFVYALCVLISKIFDAIPYANKLIKI